MRAGANTAFKRWQGQTDTQNVGYAWHVKPIPENVSVNQLTSLRQYIAYVVNGIQKSIRKNRSLSLYICIYTHSQNHMYVYLYMRFRQYRNRKSKIRKKSQSLFPFFFRSLFNKVTIVNLPWFLPEIKEIHLYVSVLVSVLTHSHVHNL